MKSVMSHSFSQVPTANIQRSSFDRSHGHKTTFDSGYLVPVFIDEVLPGDTFNCRMSGFARLATPLYPIMDNMNLDTQFFAVPIRLIWDNWQKFNGERKNPNDSIDYLVPTMKAPSNGGYAAQSLSDYFGIPTGIPELEHCSFWHRAYNLIYNEWYRDQNLQDSLPVPTGDGPDNPADFVLKRRGKRHDYFTSCLPWPQKGESVDLPLGQDVPIYGTGVIEQNGAFRIGPSSGTRSATIGHPAKANGLSIDPTLSYNGSGSIDAQSSTFYKSGLSFDPEGGEPLYADLSDATAATINQLRQAFQVQRLLERDARGGTRYIEIIKSHFGVTSPDSRLQRPEYLGGGSTAINISPVAQTSASNETSPQGNLAAIGTIGFSGHGFTKSFTEHCVIIGLASVRADLNYQQGLNRMFSRRTRYDFYWPALSHIGEQAVLNKEIYAQNNEDDDKVFGYQERYAEYRYKPSLITGKFRSTDPQSLDAWHLAQEFDSLPLLNAEFIEENPPLERVVAVQNEPQFIMDSYFNLRCSRPMPVYSVPGLIDHF